MGGGGSFPTGFGSRRATAPLKICPLVILNIMFLSPFQTKGVETYNFITVPGAVSKAIRAEKNQRPEQTALLKKYTSREEKNSW